MTYWNHNLLPEFIQEQLKNAASADKQIALLLFKEIFPSGEADKRDKALIREYEKRVDAECKNVSKTVKFLHGAHPEYFIQE